MKPMQVSTDTPTTPGDTADINIVTAQIEIDDKIKFWRRFWRIFVVVLIVIFAIIIIIIVSTENDGKNDETPAPTIDYLDSISLPLSNKFTIESYNNPTTSIITKPRAIRSAYYNGATILYIGSSDFKADRAYVMIDRDSDGVNDDEYIIFESSSVDGNEFSPASLALSFDGNSDLYIALTDSLIKCDGNVHAKVLAFTSMDERLTDCNKILDIPLTPEDAQKSWNVRRYIGISSRSNQLCMANGMTCDNCAHHSVDITFPHGTITCFNDLSSTAMMNTNMSDSNDANIVVIADGVRNSVGFDWHPVNDGFYFTDNGRDEVHEYYPDDELNFVDNNNHFGFPYCHSLGAGYTNDRNVGCTESYIDPNVTSPTDVNCSKYQNALQPLGAHVVPLGMRFYTGNMLPTDFTNTIFIAERGSGDADSFGYRIAVVQLSEDGTQVLNHEIFADGFYDYYTKTIYGRPVDIAILNDGSMVISDDHSHGIFRITYTDSARDESIFDTDTSQDICDYSYVTFPVPYTINLPSNNFNINYYTSPDLSIIKQPRALRTAYYNGATLVYVGSKQKDMDQAYVMIDYESDGVNDAEYIIFESSSVDGNGFSPASLALSFDGNHDLYIALTDSLIKCDGNVHAKVLVFDSMDDRLTDCNKILDIPITTEDAQKSWNVRRYIGISSTSNQLCMANGVTCDNCADDSVDITFPHGTITCFNDLSSTAMMNTNMSDINDANINVIDGVRNSVGFDWHPVNDGFYFTDNGRDKVHEYYPDDELNFVDNNNHFGFPECHSLGSGQLILRDINCEESYIDPNISNPASINCSMYQNAFQSLGPHVVPLGMRFYDGNMLPMDYINSIFIAERGSGDSDSFGYRIAVVKLSEDGTQVIDHQIFADGWYDYDNNKKNGRPVDIAILNDGSLLISDDHQNGAIYRITYNGDRNDGFLSSTGSNPSCNFSYAN